MELLQQAQRETAEEEEDEEGGVPGASSRSISGCGGVDQSMIFHSTYPMESSSSGSAGGSTSVKFGSVLAQSIVIESDDEDFDVSEEGSEGSPTTVNKNHSISTNSISGSSSETDMDGSGSVGMSMFQSAYANLCDSVADASVYSSEAPRRGSNSSHTRKDQESENKGEHVVNTQSGVGGGGVNSGGGEAATGPVVAPSNSSLKLRVHFRCISIALPPSDPAVSTISSAISTAAGAAAGGPDLLFVMAEHMLISAAVNTRVDSFGSLTSATKLDITVREFGVFDQHSGDAASPVPSVQPLLTFEDESTFGRGTIISAPCIRLVLNSNSSSTLAGVGNSKSDMKVEVRPIVASVTIDRINFWTRAFSAEENSGKGAGNAPPKSPIREAKGTEATTDHAVARCEPPPQTPTEIILEFRSIRLILVSDSGAYAALMDPALGERGNYLKLLQSSISNKNNGKTSSKSSGRSNEASSYGWTPMGSLTWTSGGKGGGDAQSLGSMHALLRQTMTSRSIGSASALATENVPVRLAHFVPHCGLLVHALDVCIRANQPSADNGDENPKTTFEMDSLTVHVVINRTEAERILDAEEVTKVAAGATSGSSGGNSSKSSSRAKDQLFSYGIFSATSRPADDIGSRVGTAGVREVTIDLANSNNIPNTAFSIRQDDDDNVDTSNPPVGETVSSSHPSSNSGASSCGGVKDVGKAQMTMVHISAYKVAMIAQKYQYDLMMLVSNALSPVVSTSPVPATAETNGSPSTPTPPTKTNKFGLWFSATVAVIQLSQDEAAALVPSANANGAGRPTSPVSSTESVKPVVPIEYTVAIQEPMIQVLVVDSCTRVCINANDISIYERPVDLPQQPRDEHTGAWASNVGPRWGEQRYNIPLIHRTKLRCPWDYSTPEYQHQQQQASNGNSKGINQQGISGQALPHVFEFEMVLDESMQGAVCHKRMGVKLALQDVTLRYDLSSVWLLNIIDILTPAIDERVQKEDDEGEGEATSSTTENEMEQSQQMDLSAVLQSDVFHDPLADSTAVSAAVQRKHARRARLTRTESPTPVTYRMTTISILVSRFMVDYCCPLTPSRVLFSVGILSLDSNMNSISTQVKLKFKVHDVALHLSNRLNDRHHGYLEQAPLIGRSGEYEYPSGIGSNTGVVTRRRQSMHVQQITEMDIFLDTHMFVQLCTLDFIDLIVTINDNFSGAALCIGSTVGVCCMYACLDSLNILVKTLTNWWEQFKPDEDEEEDNAEDDINRNAIVGGTVQLTEEQSRFRNNSVVGGPSEAPMVMPLYPVNEEARAAATTATIVAGTPAPSVKPNWLSAVDENAFAPRPKTRATPTAPRQEHFVPLSKPFIPYIGGSEENQNTSADDQQWGMSSTMLNMRSVLEDGEPNRHQMGGSGYMSRSGITGGGGGGGLTGAMIDDFFPMPERLRESIYPGVNHPTGGSSSGALASTGIDQSESVDMNGSSFQQARWYPVYDSEEEEEGTAGDTARGRAGGDEDEDDGFQVYYEDEEDEEKEEGERSDEEEEVAPRVVGGITGGPGLDRMSHSTPALRRYNTVGGGAGTKKLSQSQRLMTASIPSVVTLQSSHLENYMSAGVIGGDTGITSVSVSTFFPDESVVASAAGSMVESLGKGTSLGVGTIGERPRQRLTPKFAPSPHALTPMSPTLPSVSNSALGTAVNVDTDEEGEDEESEAQRHYRRERAKSDEIDTEQNLIVLDDFCNSGTCASNSVGMFYSAQLPAVDRSMAGGAMMASLAGKGVGTGMTSSQAERSGTMARYLSQSHRHWVKDTAAIREEAEPDDSDEGESIGKGEESQGQCNEFGGELDLDSASVISNDMGMGFEERIPRHKFGFQGSAASTSGMYMSVLGSWMGGAPAKPAPEPEALEMSDFGAVSKQQKLQQMGQSRLVTSGYGSPSFAGGGTDVNAHYGDSSDSEEDSKEESTPDLKSSLELQESEQQDGPDTGATRDVAATAGTMGVMNGPAIGTDGVLRRADEAIAGDEDYQRAWRGRGQAGSGSDSLDALSGSSGPGQVKVKVQGRDQGVEQQARWYDQAEQAKIISHHVPLVTAQQNNSLEFEVLELIHDDRHHELQQGTENQRSREGSLVPTCIVKLQLSIRLRLFAGCDWENSREKATPAPRADSPMDSASGGRTSSSARTASESVDSVDAVGGRSKRDLMRSSVDAFLGEVNDASCTASATARNTAKNASVSMTSSGRLFKEGRAAKPLARDEETDRKEAARAQARAHAQAHLSREMQDMLEVSVKDAQVYIRLYPRTAMTTTVGSTSASATPCERIMCNAQDILVSYAKVGFPNTKILGCYKSASHPRQCNVPFISLGLVGYLCSHDNVRASETAALSTDDAAVAADAASVGPAVEYRLNVSVIPVRVFLDENVINFVKGTLELSQQLVVSGVALDPSQLKPTKPVPADAVMFFQMVQIRPIDIKIDYNASPVDFAALHQGDYLQILNMCPLDGLSITLGAILLTGISNNNNALIDKILEIWTNHIIKYQLHRIVTGATPFGRGISNISTGIQNLLMIPLREFNNRNRAHAHAHAQAQVQSHDDGAHAGSAGAHDADAATGGSSAMVRQITRGTASLLSTVTREALHYSHKLTMYVAHGIADLAAENSENRPRAERVSSHIQQRGRARQPQNLKEGLRMGLNSMTREVHTAMDTVLVVPVKHYQETGDSKTLVKEVVTALPIAILRPIGGAAEAVSYTLLGLRNRLDPNARVEEEDLFQVEHAAPAATGRGITAGPSRPMERTSSVATASPFTASSSSGSSSIR